MSNPQVFPFDHRLFLSRVSRPVPPSPCVGETEMAFSGGGRNRCTAAAEAAAQRQPHQTALLIQPPSPPGRSKDAKDTFFVCAPKRHKKKTTAQRTLRVEERDRAVEVHE